LIRNYPQILCARHHQGLHYTRFRANVALRVESNQSATPRWGWKKPSKRGESAKIGYALLYPIAKIAVARMPWYLKAQDDLKTKGVAQIGGITIRPGGSIGSSGGFSSGGGISGAGGRSGGGGASGSW